MLKRFGDLAESTGQGFGSDEERVLALQSDVGQVQATITALATHMQEESYANVDSRTALATMAARISAMSGADPLMAYASTSGVPPLIIPQATDLLDMPSLQHSNLFVPSHRVLVSYRLHSASTLASAPQPHVTLPTPPASDHSRLQLPDKELGHLSR